MRKAVAVGLAVAVLAVALVAAASARRHDGSMDLDDPSALRAVLSHHDSRMDGREDPHRFLEKLPGKEPRFYGAGHEDEEDDDADNGEDDGADDADDEAAGVVDEERARHGKSRGLRDAYKTYRFRGTTENRRALYFRFQELSAKAERGELTADEAMEMEALRRRGFFKKVGKVLKDGAKAAWKGIKKVGKKVGGAVLGVAGAAAAGASKVVNGGNKKLDDMLAQDIEDCVGCRFVWLGVELEVGNSQVEETVYDSFVKRCMEAEKAPIFFQTCQDMFDDVYGMIGDYMNGYTVNQVCEGAKMCR